MTEKMLDTRLVWELIRQMGEHSGNLCNLLAHPRTEENLEEAQVQNACIQEALVSFCDLYLPDQFQPPPMDKMEMLKLVKTE